MTPFSLSLRPATAIAVTAVMLIAAVAGALRRIIHLDDDNSFSWLQTREQR